jgi:hypothetical protein
MAQLDLTPYVKLGQNIQESSVNGHGAMFTIGQTYKLEDFCSKLGMTTDQSDHTVQILHKPSNLLTQHTMEVWVALTVNGGPVKSVPAAIHPDGTLMLNFSV